MEVVVLLIIVILFAYFKIYYLDNNKKTNYKDLITREDILESSDLFVVNDTNFIKSSTLLTLDEKKNILINIYSKDGFTVNNISDTQMQFRKEKTFSLLWAIVWLCVFLVGLLVYIFYYMSKSDTIITVTLDPSNCKNDIKKDFEDKSTVKSSKAKELLELKDMLEKELITKEEFEKLKSELFNIS